MIAQYSWWWLVLFLLIAAGLSFVLYYRDKSLSELEKWKKVILSSLRFLSIFFILSLLFSPLIKTVKRVIEKPIIVIAQDNSESVRLNTDSAYYSGQYAKDIQSLINNLSNDYQVVQYNFGDRVRLDSVIDFTDKSTDMSDLFSVIRAAYSGRNLGAVIIASDGIFNVGENPIYSTKVSTNLYSIALGDTLQSKDAYVKQVQHNRVAFFKNRFPVRIVVGAGRCRNENIKVSVIKNKEKLFEKELLITDDEFIGKIEIELEASAKGLQEYEVIITPVTGEISIENNHQTFVVDVVDNKQNVLILGNSPHPDIGAFAMALKTNPDFNVSIQYAGSFNEPLSKYQLVILHQIPSVSNAAGNILQQVAKNNVSCIYILGAKTSVDAFNQAQSGLKIITSKSAYDEATPVYQTTFSSYSNDPEWIEIVYSLPPLVVPFGNYQLGSASRTLMTQKINSVPTERPLISFTNNGSNKNGYITGEGLWRWRIESYRLSGSHQLFNDFINKLVQFTITTHDKQSLIVDSKRVFNENEPVILDAEFYDEAYELNNQAEVEIIITDQNRKALKKIFDRNGNYYSLNVGSMLPGRYAYAASMTFGEKNYTASGEFIVVEVNLEEITTKANHTLLYKIALDNGGKLVYPKQIGNLESYIRSNKNIVTNVYEQIKLSNLIDLKILFFIILILLSCEWFLRKFWGSY